MKALKSLHGNLARHWVGNGFPVRTLFNYEELGESVSPFLLLDHAGPAQFPPAEQPRGVGPHPHRGFETVTIVYEGELEHRDSTGSGGRIGPGDVQWMTAASGILHEEFHSHEFTRTGGTLEMVQLWVNLPARDKLAPAGYQTILDGDIPALDLPDDQGRIRIIAGDYLGHAGPARTFTPINAWDLQLAAGREITLPVPEGHSTALIILKGGVEAGAARAPVEPGRMALFAQDGADLQFVTTSGTRALLLSGEPLREPIAGYGPFVMNTQQEIRQALQDYQQGRFGQMSPA